MLADIISLQKIRYTEREEFGRQRRVRRRIERKKGNKGERMKMNGFWKVE